MTFAQRIHDLEKGCGRSNDDGEYIQCCGQKHHYPASNTFDIDYCPECKAKITSWKEAQEMVEKTMNKIGNDWEILQDTTNGEVEPIEFQYSEVFKELKQSLGLHEKEVVI